MVKERLASETGYTGAEAEKSWEASSQTRYASVNFVSCSQLNVDSCFQNEAFHMDATVVKLDDEDSWECRHVSDSGDPAPPTRLRLDQTLELDADLRH